MKYAFLSAVLFLCVNAFASDRNVISAALQSRSVENSNLVERMSILEKKMNELILRHNETGGRISVLEEKVTDLISGYNTIGGFHNKLAEIYSGTKEDIQLLFEKIFINQKLIEELQMGTANTHQQSMESTESLRAALVVLQSRMNDLSRDLKMEIGRLILQVQRQVSDSSQVEIEQLKLKVQELNKKMEEFERNNKRESSDITETCSRVPDTARPNNFSNSATAVSLLGVVARRISDNS
ncbi:hypothetical protein HYV10_01045 [Candidatus Dependentiae bacterium]|nr:hypothetical protein [Candidatus Dependentiae bacterium]